MVLLLQLLLIFYWVLLAEVRMMGPGSKRWSVFLLPNETISFMSIFLFFPCSQKKCVFSITTTPAAAAAAAELLCSYSHASFTYFYNNAFSAKCMTILRQRPQFFLKIIMFWGVKIENDFGFCRVLVSIWFHTIEFCLIKWWYDMIRVGWLFIYSKIFIYYLKII